MCETNSNYVKDLHRSRDYIYNCASLGMRKEVRGYKTVEEYDPFLDATVPVQRKATLPFYTMQLLEKDALTEDIIVDDGLPYIFEDGGDDWSYVLETNIPDKYPENFSEPGFKGFERRLRNGRNAEIEVLTWLQRASVQAGLLPCIYTGDTSSVDVDLHLIRPRLDADGCFRKTGWDIKYHSDLHFSNSWGSFPEEVRIDFVHAHQRKLEASAQRGVPYHGTIHYSISGGGMFVVLNNTKKNWKTQMNTWDGKRREEYVAAKENFRPISHLVYYYTANTPELRAARKAQEEEIARGF